MTTSGVKALSFFAQNRNYNSWGTCSPPHVISNGRSWWRRTRRLTASEALCRAGATLGNWNDRVRGEHQAQNRAGQLRIERTLTWHVVDRIAGWLYVAPERRPS